MYIGSNEMKGGYIGTNAVSAVYLGTEKVWPSVPYYELPSGYTALEYIENLDGAYINTNVNASNNISLHIEYEDDFYYTDASASYAVSNYIVGARNSNGILFGIGGSQTNNTILMYYNGVSGSVDGSRTRGRKYVADLKASSTGMNYTMSIDGTKYSGTITGNMTTTGVPIYLFAFGTSYVKKETKLSLCYIKSGNTVVRYYLPCFRNSDGTVGLYDCVNNLFHESSNSSYKFMGNGLAQYLTIKITGATAGSIWWRCTGATSSSTSSYKININKNGNGWTAKTPSTSSASSSNRISVASGDTLYIASTGTNVTRYGTGTNAYCFISGNTDFIVEGNIMSVFNSGSYATNKTIPATYGLCRFFRSPKITSAENLLLPATALTDYCYYGMFYGCSALTAGPELPATTLGTYCYGNMFNACTRLTTAPELPATALTTYCYYAMFYGCTTLTTAPELPATTLKSYCYRNMFTGCTSLNYIKCLASSGMTSSYCLQGWVSGVASTGTFVKSPNATTGSTAGASQWAINNTGGIPTGWTVQDAT